MIIDVLKSKPFFCGSICSLLPPIVTHEMINLSPGSTYVISLHLWALVLGWDAQGLESEKAIILMLNETGVAASTINL